MFNNVLTFKSLLEKEISVKLLTHLHISIHNLTITIHEWTDRVSSTWFKTYIGVK